jgi:hypothetical protein
MNFRFARCWGAIPQRIIRHNFAIVDDQGSSYARSEVILNSKPGAPALHGSLLTSSAQRSGFFSVPLRCNGYTYAHVSKVPVISPESAASIC